MTTRTAKYGPKPKPAARKQTVQVMVRLTKAEAAELDEKRGSVPRGTFIRQAYLNAKSRGGVPAVNMKAYSELSRSASNLNQLMKRLNNGGAIRDYASDLKQALTDFRAKLIGASE